MFRNWCENFRLITKRNNHEKPNKWPKKSTKWAEFLLFYFQLKTLWFLFSIFPHSEQLSTQRKLSPTKSALFRIFLTCETPFLDFYCSQLYFMFFCFVFFSFANSRQQWIACKVGRTWRVLLRGKRTGSNQGNIEAWSVFNPFWALPSLTNHQYRLASVKTLLANHFAQFSSSSISKSTGVYAYQNIKFQGVFKDVFTPFKQA